MCRLRSIPDAREFGASRDDAAGVRPGPREHGHRGRATGEAALQVEDVGCVERRSVQILRQEASLTKSYQIPEQHSEDCSAAISVKFGVRCLQYVALTGISGQSEATAALPHISKMCGL